VERDAVRGVVAELFPKYQAGDRDAFDRLVAVVARELRGVALEQQRRMPESAGPAALTALYAAVVGDAGLAPADRAAFLPVCARAMRVVVVDYLRTPPGAGHARAPQVLALDQVLDAIERFNWRMVRVVEGLYFAALPETEAARALRIDPAELRRDWTRARSWLVKELPAYSPASPDREVSVANAAWVDAVFDDALALGEEEREAFLDRCSSVSPNLRRDVDELVRLSDRPLPGFEPGGLPADLLWAILTGLDPMPEMEPDNPSSPEMLPLPVGAWADPPAATTEAAAVSAFPDNFDPESLPEAEGVRSFVPPEAPMAAIESLRRLAHPNIARVLDVTHAADGGAVVVFEPVDGRPIDRYCDEELLPVAARLDLFLDVCAAVQYGHRKLVAHGAIEPATVVVTAGREVKLLDYGLAALGDDGDRDDGPRRPSRDYASPEHVSGEPLTVASDVYQLGLLLYELLTGERAQAVTGTTRAALERAVCEEAVVRPSARVLDAPDKHAAARRLRPAALARTLRGDLDAIVMYALRKEPERRYPSVSALRSDVQRHRRRMPIWVRSDSVAYRVRTFLVRRRLAVAAVLVALIAGAALLAGPIRARLRATQATAGAARVEQVLGEMLGAVTTSPEGPPTALGFVDHSARLARHELASAPAARARLLTTIGGAYADLGHYGRSLETLEEALALRRAHFADDSIEVAETLEALGRTEHLMGRYDEAEASLRSVLAVRQVRAGAGHPATIGAAIALGDLLHTRGQLQEAEQILRGAVGTLRPEVVMAGSDAPANTLLPRAMRELGGVLRDRGVPGESAALYREAIAMLQHPGREEETELSLARIDFARLLAGRGELDRADAELGAAIPALQRDYQADHPALARALLVLATLRMEQRRFDEADALLRDVRRTQEQRLGRIHPAVPQTRALQAELARRRGALPDAIAGARQALDDFDRLGLEAHHATIDVRLTLGEALLAAGEADEAMRVLAAGLATAERLFVQFDPRIARLQAAVTRAARDSGSR
jgi:tetratricopeptide (TPR) repeat protein